MGPPLQAVEVYVKRQKSIPPLRLILNSPRLYGQYKKAPGRKYRVLVGEASRQRRLSSLKLDTLVIVKVDISVNHLVGLRESGWLMSVNTLCFKDGEEIFGHGIVIRVSPS